MLRPLLPLWPPWLSGWGLAAVLGIGLAGAVSLVLRVRSRLVLARAAAAYVARTLCSGVLLAGMEPERLWHEELAMARGLVNARILEDRGEVLAEALWGIVKARAVRHPGLGCSLQAGGVHPVPLPPPNRAQASDPPATDAPWPLAPAAARTPPRAIGRPALRAVLEAAFREAEPQRPMRTRAVVVVRDGWVVAERYAPGIAAGTPLIGWSMAKSLTHALVGIAVTDGLLATDRPVPVPEWSSSDDPRRAITLELLLRMRSGLAFSEVYDDFSSDVITMLLQAPDAGAFAAGKPLTAAPGEVWAYASGSTNIISRGLRLAMADDRAYWRFPYERLFEPLGMHSAVLETDASGTFIGSSLAYATGRDWARFGQLYLQDGVWGDRRILPPGWVRHATTATPDSEGRYGAHWGLNQGGFYPDLPRDAFHAHGFGGQLVLVVPSRQTVIVRLGQTPGDDFDVNTFAGGVLRSL